MLPAAINVDECAATPRARRRAHLGHSGSSLAAICTRQSLWKHAWQSKHCATRSQSNGNSGFSRCDAATRCCCCFDFDALLLLAGGERDGGELTADAMLVLDTESACARGADGSGADAGRVGEASLVSASLDEASGMAIRLEAERVDAVARGDGTDNESETETDRERVEELNVLQNSQ